MVLERRSFLGALVSLPALSPATAVMAQESGTVRIGQATSAVSFLPIWAARALDTFKPQGLALKWAAIPGGDPTALAALDAGDIDLAAVGTDTTLAAIAKGQEFELVYALMSQMTIELVVSNAFLKRTGVSPADPLRKRIQALKGATVGVSAVRGAQDRVARWLAAQGGLNPVADIKVALIGAPVAIHAALDHEQIDAFALSPPEGFLTEQAGTGKVLIRIGAELPGLQDFPSLALVARKPLEGARLELAVKTARALQAASEAVLADPHRASTEIQRQFFAKEAPQALFAAIETMKGGIARKGELSRTGIEALLRFTAQTDPDVAAKLAARAAEGDFWTNSVAVAAGASPAK